MRRSVSAALVAFGHLALPATLQAQTAPGPAVTHSASGSAAAQTVPGHAPTQSASGPAADRTAPGAIVVREAWSRATPGGAKVGAGYLVVENAGAAADRLVGAEAEVAGRVELHETTESGGVSRMRPVEAVAAAPGARIEFRPGGHHLMLVELKRPLKQGERFAGALLFEKAGRVPVTFEVRGLGAGHGAHTAH